MKSPVTKCGTFTDEEEEIENIIYKRFLKKSLAVTLYTYGAVMGTEEKKNIRNLTCFGGSGKGKPRRPVCRCKYVRRENVLCI